MPTTIEEDQMQFMIVDFKGERESPDALYTMKDKDWTDENGKTYLSLRRLFVESEDPTGYKLSEIIGFKLFKNIWNSPKFASRIPVWEEELSLRLRSKGLDALVKASSTSVPAAKYLADKQWVSQKNTKVARTAKTTEDSKLLREYEDDAKRIGLSIVK